MKLQRVGIVLIFLFLISITIVGYTLVRYEQKQRTQDLLDKGSYLVSLVTLYSMRDFEGRQGAFFLRTLYESLASEGLVYCLILKSTGQPLVVLDPHTVISKIPPDIQKKPLYAMGLTKQTFKLTDSNDVIYEFAKPIFENGERTGTLRLGFRLAAISLFSLERIGILAIIAFFIFAMVPLVYYGITLALRPFKDLNQDLRNIGGEAEELSHLTKKREREIDDVIQSLHQSLNLFKERYKKLEADNIELEAKSGLIAYERKQITNILDSVHYGIIITDTQDNINHINAYMLNLIDKKRSEVIDHPLGAVLEHEEILSFVSQQEGGGKTTPGKHMETTFPDLAPGEIFQVAPSYLGDSEGAVVGKVISIKNITAEKMAEKAKHEFIAHAAHELRAPLTTIKAYNEMLLGDEIDDMETKKEFYNTISEETDRLASLIENLLNISKIEMGSLSINAGLVKIDWLVNGCIAAIEAPAQKKHITIEKHLPDKFPSLVGDKELLKVALINILGNAVKYTPENGTITFSLTDQDHTISFDVSDTGYGISPEELPHIFEKFYRSSNPQVAKHIGSGLGLAMTLEIVHLHGGEIEVESESGKGTHFIITVPKEEYYLGKQ